MPNIELSVRHVATRSALPSTLVQGRLYFIDDEGTIVINHGDGAIDYGAAVTARGAAQAIGDISQLTTPNTTDLVSAINSMYDLLDGAYDVKQYSGVAGLRKTQYRGSVNLGERPTAEQLLEMKNGTFKNIYLGDYWERSVTYKDMNDNDVTKTLRYYIVEMDVNQIIVFSNNSLFTAPFWASGNTGKGYVSSYIFTEVRPKILGALQAFFGEDYVLYKTTSGTGQCPYGTVGANSVSAYYVNGGRHRYGIPFYSNLHARKPAILHTMDYNDAERKGMHGVDEKWQTLHTWDFCKLKDEFFLLGLYEGTTCSWIADPYPSGAYALAIGGYKGIRLLTGLEDRYVCGFGTIIPGGGCND